MNKVHGLPVWTADGKIDESGGIVATEKAFDGVLKIYNISVDNNDIDLLGFMRGKQNQIQNAIRLNTQLQPQKPQKTSADHITIFSNSKPQRVDFPGLSNKSFSEMTEQMILTLNNFSSQGSGWSINQIKNF